MVESLEKIGGISRRWSTGLLLASAAFLLAFGGLVAGASAQTHGSQDGPDLPSTGQSPEDGVQETKSLRKRVLYQLSGYHFSPSREELDALAEPEKVAETLREIAADESMRPSLRGRAVDVLGLYQSDAIASFLEGMAEPPAEELSDEQKRVAITLRHRAIMSLAQLYDDQRAVERLAGLLEADDRQIRLTVVAALGQYAGQPGKKRLKEFASQVDDEIVRQEVSGYVDLKDFPQSGD